MPKLSKSKTVTETPATASTATATATATSTATPSNTNSTAAITGTKKAPRATKSKTVVVETAAVETAAVETVAVETATIEVETAATETDDITAQSTEFIAKLSQLGALLASVKADYRILEKKWTRELKIAQKCNAKRNRKSGNRQPSGFVKPTKISDELADFLEKDRGTEMARTDVTREINKYIRSNSLQDKDNGRKIIPDSKLQTLLKLKITDELTYFNLQRYMSPHFYKADKAIIEASSAAM